MRQNKFPTALLLTPEEGLANETQTTLRSFGLKKLSVVREFAELQKQVIEHAFELVLIDTDCLVGTDRADIVQRIRSLKEHTQGIFVAISQIESRDDLIALREQGFSTVLIKPVSIGMMEQALSEVLERERKQPVDRDALVRVHALFLRGGTFEAERTLSIWLEKESESLEGLTLLALQQLKKQEFYRAGATINKVLKIKADYLPALQLKTRISLRLGQLSEASLSLSKEEKAVARLEAKRVHEPGHTLTAAEKAELSFCEEFETREGMTALLNNLALQLSKTGRTEDALVLYRKAMGPLESPDSRFITLFNRGRLYLSIKRGADAKRDLIEARRLCPEELYTKIDELIALCDTPELPSALDQLRHGQKRSGATLVPDLLSEKPSPKKQPKYRAFNGEEVLEMVFQGKMEESTVPPDSVAEWLQMKKKLMHILFLNELPLAEEPAGDSLPETAQEST